MITDLYDKVKKLRAASH